MVRMRTEAMWAGASDFSLSYAAHACNLVARAAFIGVMARGERRRVRDPVCSSGGPLHPIGFEHDVQWSTCGVPKAL